MARHLVCITFDFDTVALWLALGQTTPTAMSRGEFGVVAAHRLLGMLSRLGVTSTWFVPGVTAETFPEACRAIVAAGHEIAHHGFDHVSPAGLDRADEVSQLERGNAVLERVCGRRALGYRSPAWELSRSSVELLVEAGFEYDSSMMGHDYLPYYARRGDVVEAGQPIRFGPTTPLVELPVSWSLDDFPHFEYFRGGGLRPASGVLENWLADFDYLTEEFEWGALTVTCHPFVIGRGHRMKMLERFIVTVRDRGAEFVTARDLAAEYRSMSPPPRPRP